MARRRAFSFTPDISVGGLYAVFDHPCNDLSEIKPAFYTLLIQTVYPEKGITAGKKINDPGKASCIFDPNNGRPVAYLKVLRV